MIPPETLELETKERTMHMYWPFYTVHKPFAFCLHPRRLWRSFSECTWNYIVNNEPLTTKYSHWCPSNFAACNLVFLAAMCALVWISSVSSLYPEKRMKFRLCVPRSLDFFLIKVSSSFDVFARLKNSGSTSLFCFCYTWNHAQFKLRTKKGNWPHIHVRDRITWQLHFGATTGSFLSGQRTRSVF